MNNKILTHQHTSKKLVGEIVELNFNEAKVKLVTNKDMCVDDYNLIHGGFVFGLADYAAMLAVNKPTVVLGKSEVKFLKPVQLGDKLFAIAKIEKETLEVKNVKTDVFNQNNEIVFTGNFKCYVLKKHVLVKNKNI